MIAPRSGPSPLLIPTPPAEPGWRIGLMGGSFNPPHEGHMRVAEAALTRLGLDRLWWVVTPGNPLKDVTGLSSLSARVEACNRLARHPKMAVTAFEADLGCSYTAETIGFLAHRFPRVSFVWVMGGDNLASFHRWRDWRAIAGAVPIAVIDRPDWRFKALASPAGRALARYRVTGRAAGQLASLPAPAWTYLSIRLSDLSSTALRAAANHGE